MKCKDFAGAVKSLHEIGIDSRFGSDPIGYSRLAMWKPADVLIG
jgi:hypothetical protein